MTTATKSFATRIKISDFRPPSQRPRYRLRTMLRENLPEIASAWVPKGRHDCRAHEWYQAAARTWRCYHCIVGETHEVPWDEREYEARLLEADAMRVRAGLPVQQHLSLGDLVGRSREPEH